MKEGTNDQINPTSMLRLYTGVRAACGRAAVQPVPGWKARCRIRARFSISIVTVTRIMNNELFYLLLSSSSLKMTMNMIIMN